MADPLKRRATYQDVLDAPEHLVAEIIGGEVRLSPRPASAHAAATSTLGYLLGPPFQLGSRGPGGWMNQNFTSVPTLSFRISVAGGANACPSS